MDYGKCLVVNIRSMTKKTFCVKNPFLAKNAIFSKNKVQNKEFLGSIQAPNMSKHISRNRGATFKLLEKQLMTKFFFKFWSEKAIFSPQKWWHH